jgi:Mg-chelatase subunit ChlD
MSRKNGIAGIKKSQYLRKFSTSLGLACTLLLISITGTVSAAGARVTRSGTAYGPAAVNDASLTSPVASGQILTIVHGYNDPLAGETCDIGNKLGIAATKGDHCLHQKYGLDLRPSDLNDKNILAPLPGIINWEGTDCLGILTNDNLNLTICHFDHFDNNISLHGSVKRGQILGTRSQNWIHLSLDDRYDGQHNQRLQSSWIPIPFNGSHTIEGQSFEPKADSDRNQYNNWTIGSNNNNSNNGVGTSTVLVFDISGSMSELDPSGIVKLEAAKSAGGNILDIIAAENQASGQNDNQVSIASFSDSAWLNIALTTDISASRSALDGLYPESSTAMPAGLQTAIGALANNLGNGKPIIILLSDGMPNVDLSGGNDESAARQQTLDLSKQAGQKGICVYTVGFGDPTGYGNAGLDEDFLKQVATNSGCGSYYNAKNAIQLADVFVQLRHSSTGNILLNQTGRISQGQHVDIGTAAIPVNQALALFTLNWPGSRLDALLTDPAGKVVDTNYPGASISITNSIVSIILQNPMAGEWKFAAIGADVPEGITDYNAILSVRPNPVAVMPPSTPISSGIPFVLLVVAGGGVLMYAVARVNKRRSPASRKISAGGFLVGVSGSLANRTLPLTDGMLIGRGSTCAIRLAEASVSRTHARLRSAQGIWFIQDLNSAQGTFVNGQRIQATRLNNGDRIRIGSSEMEFHG